MLAFAGAQAVEQRSDDGLRGVVSGRGGDSIFAEADGRLADLAEGAHDAAARLQRQLGTGQVAVRPL